MQRPQHLVIIVISVILHASALADGQRSSSPDRKAPTPGGESIHITQGAKNLRAGWEAYQQGDLPSALGAYQEAVKAAPSDASLWYDLGCLYALTGDPFQAESALKRALSLNLELADSHDAIGQLRELADDLDGALASYASAVTLKPGNAKFLRHMARVHLRRNDHPAARDALRRLLERDPSDVEARYQLGVLQLKADQPDLAIHEFNEVLERSDDHILALNGLGVASARIGALDQAAQALERAKALDPDSSATHTNLGVLSAAQERWDDARGAWRRALELSPHYPPAAKNLETLDGQPPPASP